jgi:nitrite reductase/ring-hydroxylating ferredoxin subunit
VGELAAALESDRLRSGSLSPVAIDVLMDNLGIKYKRKFESIDESTFASVRDHLVRERISSASILAIISKKTWKHLPVAAGIKVLLEQAHREDEQVVERMRSRYEGKIEKVEEATMVVSVGELHYRVRRFCPHKQADLSNAHIRHGILTCPRHRWQFDLSKGGICSHKGASLDAALINW